MKLWALIFILFHLPVYSDEIDSFSPRYINFPDGLHVVSEEVNRRIKVAVTNANSVSNCNKLILQTYLAFELLRPTYGKIEQFVNNSDTVPKKNILFANSVYRNVPEPHAFLFGIGEVLFSFGNVVREGKWLFYLKLNDDASNLEEVLDSSIWTEDTYCRIS